MCSGNAAKVLGIYNSDQSTGSLETGKNADILIGSILNDSPGYRFRIDDVFLKGTKII